MDILDRFQEIVSETQTGERCPIVVEAGACDGYHTDLLCQAMGERDYVLHAFEPCLNLINSLASRNARHFPRLKIVPAALGATDGWVRFFQSSGYTESEGVPTENFYGSSSMKAPGVVTDLWPAMRFQNSW